MSHEQILERTVRSKAQGSGRQPIEAISSKGNFEENELGEAENSVSVTPRSSKGRLENSLRGTIRSEKSSANQGQATKAARTSKSSGKDRHSKVNTAKGPRDRRVRLSVSTAIQFYDIQDRLGFDQPSKAIEWLLKKAKPAIDELSQLPPVPVGESSHNAALKEEESSARPTTTSEPLSPGSYQHYHLRQSPSSTPKEVQGEGSGQAHSSPGIWKHDAEFGAGLTDSRAKARERARERVKDKSSGPSIAPQSHHEPFQHTFLGNQSSLFDSLYSSSGGGPMRSSFTQLLQSPVPTAIIHSSSQNLLQNQFFSTLQGVYPSQPDRSMHSSFQQRGALQHDHILHGQPPPELPGGADLHRYHSFGSPFIQVPMISGSMFGGAQNVLQAASAMNSRHFRDEALQVPFGRGYFSSLNSLSQPGGASNSGGDSSRQPDHQQQHAANPFANRIPARIQGIDDMDEQEIQHSRSHHHHSSS